MNRWFGRGKECLLSNVLSQASPLRSRSRFFHRSTITPSRIDSVDLTHWNCFNDPFEMIRIPTHRDLVGAARRIEGKVLRTPLVHSEQLSRTTGARVYLKLDSLQPGGSFKLRGATNAVASLTEEERHMGVVAASSGNYGTALALAAKRAGIEATIVLPDNAPPVKVERIRKAGAKIIRYGSHYGESEQKAAELGSKGLILIHPFDDPLVVAGQGTIALEIDQDAPRDLDLAIVPIGGGGLFAGVALGFKQTRPDLEIVGVEPHAAPSMTRALEVGRPVPIEPLPTCADGLSPRITGEISFQVAQTRLSCVQLLTEEELLAGVRFCFRELKLVVEPSGASGIGALIAGKVETEGRTIAVVVSGGNLDQRYFSDIVSVTRLSTHKRHATGQ